MVIDDKGGEVNSQRLVLQKEGDQIILRHTSRGGKLKNLLVAFGCALHMLGYIAQVFYSPIHACVVLASYKIV